jgi:Fic family protein
VPVPEGQLLVAGVSHWEKWINRQDDNIPLVVKAAVGHYQLETLHPFSDGNGRLGRLVVVLQLMEAGVLAYPILNLSPWLKLRKEEYKSLLRDVSLTGDFDPWVHFFATAIEAQAADMVQRIAFAKLEKMGILREVTGAKYGRIFVCPMVRRIATRP